MCIYIYKCIFTYRHIFTHINVSCLQSIICMIFCREYASSQYLILSRCFMMYIFKYIVWHLSNMMCECIYIYIFTSSTCRSLMCKLDNISLRCCLADPWWPWDDPWWCAAAPSAEIRVRGTNLGAFVKRIFGALMILFPPFFFPLRIGSGWCWPFLVVYAWIRRRRASPVVEDPVNLPIAPVSSLQWMVQHTHRRVCRRIWHTGVLLIYLWVRCVQQNTLPSVKVL